TVDDTTLPRPMGDCGAGTTRFVSDFACYTVRAEDVLNGQVTVQMNYKNGLAHAGPTNVPGIASGSARLAVLEQSCGGPVPDCTANVCDRDQRSSPDGVSERTGSCVVRDLPDGTPCPDTDGNPATIAGCRAGQCSQTFVTGAAGAVGPTGPMGPQG